ncbi:hypothetical protein [Paraburkholderia strydomiana]|uniref:hypothetical protein n=1 Tax=Paraburkholderia strydomiana TaxID=1245417 RepID=UPI003EC034B3
MVPAANGPRPTIWAYLRIGPEDGERIFGLIRSIHCFPWDCNGGRPVDAKPDEERPKWIDNA